MREPGKDGRGKEENYSERKRAGKQGGVEQEESKSERERAEEGREGQEIMD